MNILFVHIEWWSSINWWSIAASSAILIVFGLIYYSPKILGGPWMNSLGFKPEDYLKIPNMKSVIPTTIFMAVCISIFLISRTNGIGQEGPFDTFKHGVWHGAFLGIIVVLPTMIITGLSELRSYTNLAINSVFWIIAMSLMGGVLDMMNHWPNA